MASEEETRLHEAAVPPDDGDDTVVARAFWLSLVVLAVVGLGVWAWTRGPSERIDEEPEIGVQQRDRDDSPLELPLVPFTDVTEESGIDFVQDNGARGRKLLPETMAGGVGCIDFDSDGDADLVFTNFGAWPGDGPRLDGPEFPAVVLYRNRGDWRFEDVTEAVGLDATFHATGLAAGDYDGDGRVDLFVSAVGRNRLFRNLGDRFEDVTDTAGVGGDESDWSTSAGWFDYDRDGDADLFVCNYLDWTREDDLAQNFTLAGGRRAYGRPQNFEGSFCRLYRNDGDGRFTEVSETAGIRVRNADTGVPTGKSLGLVFADLDRDGWLDVVVANDTVRNFLFHNQRDGTFAEVSALHGIAYDRTTGQARGAMGIDVAPFRDGDSLGVAIGNFSNEMTALFVTRNDEMQFEDEANSTGLGVETRLELTFGVLFADFDLDGRLDLFSANGHLDEDIALVQSTQSYAQPPRLFWNAGPTSVAEFVPLGEAELTPDFTSPLVGRGAARADLDLDGDVDLVIATCGGPPRVLRNDQRLDGRWLRVEFGDATAAVGARIEVRFEDGTAIHRAVSPTCSYQSQSETAVTMGCGRQAGPVDVVVTHANGDVTVREKVGLATVIRFD